MKLSKIYLKSALVISSVVILYTIAIVFILLPQVTKNTIAFEEKEAKAQLEEITTIVYDAYLELEEFKKFAISEKKDELESLVTVVWDMFNAKYNELKDQNKSRVFNQEIQANLENSLKYMRYGSDGYFFVIDFNGNMIFHPTLQDKNVIDLTDIKGNKLIQSLIYNARYKDGFASYWWSKPDNKDRVYEKLSYGKVFEPWNLVLGTGVYIDHIQAQVQKRKEELLKRIKKILEKTVVGKNGYMFIVNGSGEILAHPNFLQKNIEFKSMKNPHKESYLFEDIKKAASTHQPLQYLWDKPDDINNYKYKKIAWIAYSKEFDWYIGASAYVADIEETSTRMAHFIYIIALLILAITAFYSLNFFKKLLTPIEKLSRVALDITKGELDARSNIVRRDEIGVLASSFDRMADSLQDNIQNLDNKVKAKTKALQIANDNINESIDYASVIQHSFLPNPHAFSDSFKELFVIWEPRDSVGGDLYLLRKLERGVLVGVVDCTGHGVPGGFMTMMVGSILKQIKDEDIYDNPAHVLKILNISIKKQLGQSQKDTLSDDGLDMGLCYINEAKELYFSGAKFDLYYKDEEKEMQIIKGDRKSIGYKRSDENYEFKNHKLTVLENSMFYLFSDGIIDQKGGEEGFSYSKKRLIKLLETIANEPSSLQKEKIERSLKEYQGEFVRNDDITMVGFRL